MTDSVSLEGLVRTQDRSGRWAQMPGQQLRLRFVPDSSWDGAYPNSCVLSWSYVGFAAPINRTAYFFSDDDLQSGVFFRIATDQQLRVVSAHDYATDQPILNSGVRIRCGNVVDGQEVVLVDRFVQSATFSGGVSFASDRSAIFSLLRTNSGFRASAFGLMAGVDDFSTGRPDVRQRSALSWDAGHISKNPSLLITTWDPSSDGSASPTSAGNDLGEFTMAPASGIVCYVPPVTIAKAAGPDRSEVSPAFFQAEQNSPSSPAQRDRVDRASFGVYASSSGRIGYLPGASDPSKISISISITGTPNFWQPEVRAAVRAISGRSFDVVTQRSQVNGFDALYWSGPKAPSSLEGTDPGDPYLAITPFFSGKIVVSGNESYRFLDEFPEFDSLPDSGKLRWLNSTLSGYIGPPEQSWQGAPQSTKDFVRQQWAANLAGQQQQTADFKSRREEELAAAPLIRTFDYKAIMQGKSEARLAIWPVIESSAKSIAAQNNFELSTSEAARSGKVDTLNFFSTGYVGTFRCLFWSPVAITASRETQSARPGPLQTASSSNADPYQFTGNAAAFPYFAPRCAERPLQFVYYAWEEWREQRPPLSLSLAASITVSNANPFFVSDAQIRQLFSQGSVTFSNDLYTQVSTVPQSDWTRTAAQITLTLG
jgi:hypothetical protein